MHATFTVSNEDDLKRRIENRLEDAHRHLAERLSELDKFRQDLVDVVTLVLAPPAGTMGNTFSCLSTHTSTSTGPGVAIIFSSAGRTSAGLVARMPVQPYASASFTKSGTIRVVFSPSRAPVFRSVKEWRPS